MQPFPEVIGKLIALIRNTGRALRIALELDRRNMIGLIVSASLLAAFPLLTTLVWRGLVDVLTVSESRDLSEVGWWAQMLVAVTVAQIIVSQADAYFNNVLKLNLIVRLNVDTLKHASRLDLSYFEDSDFQDHLSRSNANIGQNISLFISSTVDLVQQIVQTVSLSVLLATIDPFVVLVIVPLLVPYLWYSWQTARRRYEKQMNQTTRRRWSRFYSSRVMDSTFIPEVKIAGLGELLVQKYERVLQELRDEDYRLFTRLEIIGGTIIQILFAAVYLSAFMYAGMRVLAGTLAAGNLIVYLRTAMQFTEFTRKAGSTVSNVAEQMLYVEDWHAFKQVEPALPKSGSLRPTLLSRDLVVEGLSFQYPKTKRLALQGVSLTIEAGETVAIVGENGAGKSTLVKLLLRLYDPHGGVIRLGGYDIRSLDLEFLYQQFAYVPQTFNKYEGTAAENIAYGNWRRLLDNPHAIEDAARHANVHDLIMSMPDGYDTLLGRHFGEYDLSGGQWQRLAIARAIAHDAQIVILDEPTSSLDAQVEYEIFSQFKKLTRQGTAIIVSHRFSTIAMADRIVVMEQGCIAATGTHTRLLAESDHYAQMYALHQRQMVGESA